MVRQVSVLALIALVVLSGAGAATACCWGGWGGGWGCGWGGGCGWGSCYSHCGWGCGYSYCAPTYRAPVYCAPAYHHHCHATAPAVHHHASVSVAAPAVASNSDRGRLVVALPADATLLVDGQRTTSTSGERTFVTPPIQNGRTYFYTLTAEVNRGGVTRTVTEKVYVRAGETTQISLTPSDAGTGVAAR